ncbi:MAG: universal stress protein [Bacteroidia bacterium]
MIKDFEIKKILVATDFSEVANNALNTAIAIAKRQGASIELFHVIEVRHFLCAYPGEFMLCKNMTHEIKKGIEESMGKFAKSKGADSGVEITYSVASGNVSIEVCRKALDYNFDLIVIGTHGISGAKEFFIGSNAFSIIKEALCPVLSIPANCSITDFNKVAFPVRVHLKILEKYYFIKPFLEKSHSQLLILGLLHKDSKKELIAVGDLVYKLKDELHKDGFKYESENYISQNFAETVMQCATGFNADLVVITSNPEKQFKEFFTGTFTQQIVNRCKLPVLSINPQIKREVAFDTGSINFASLGEYYISSLNKLSY